MRYSLFILLLFCSCTKKDPNFFNAPWNGKRLVIMGDSYTERGLYFQPLKDRLNAVIINLGVSGTNVTPGYRYPDRSYFDRRHQIARHTPQMAIIFCSVNEIDANNFKPVPIGDSTSTDTLTYYGALKGVLDAVKSDARQVKVLLVAPNLIYGPDKSYTFDAQKSYHDAIIVVGRMYSIPVCDLFLNSGITFENSSQYMQSDLKHLDPATGGKIVGNLIVDKIQTIP